MSEASHAPGGPANNGAANGSAANDGAADTAHRLQSLTLVPVADEKLTTKDFKSDQEVRWCPGCGDYAILAAFQSFLPELEVPRENLVIVSGIGCSSRLPVLHEHATGCTRSTAARRRSPPGWRPPARTCRCG